MNDRHKLLWHQPLSTTTLHPLPPHINRNFIPTPRGNLELLCVQPLDPSSHRQQQVLFFLHGGFGHASVWLPYLTYFSQRGYTSYAISLRGHGASWKPGFLEMVWGSGKGGMMEDLEKGIAWVKEYERGQRGGFWDEELVVVGHSAGGGLVQGSLGRGTMRIGGLVLVAAIPFTGGLGVYWNWFNLDPWFLLRYYIRDFWHPRSPLSSTSLVHRAFFCPKYPRERVAEFEKWMPEYESMLWPLGQMLKFAKVENILKSIVGWDRGNGPRVLVVAGEKDRLMTGDVMKKLAEGYEDAMVRMFGKSWGSEGEKGGEVLRVVKGAGHHLQNDLQWEDGAEKILRFLEEL